MSQYAHVTVWVLRPERGAWQPLHLMVTCGLPAALVAACEGVGFFPNMLPKVSFTSSIASAISDGSGCSGLMDERLPNAAFARSAAHFCE